MMLLNKSYLVSIALAMSDFLSFIISLYITVWIFSVGNIGDDFNSFVSHLDGCVALVIGNLLCNLVLNTSPTLFLP